MIFQPKRIVVVRGITYGTVPLEDADRFADQVVVRLRRATTTDPHKRDVVAAAVIDVVDGEAALQKLLEVTSDVYAVVFCSIGARRLAEGIVENFVGSQRPRVVVVTGAMPEDRVQYVPKRLGPDAIATAVLSD